MLNKVKPLEREGVMKPRILVSACLGFCSCRYDGSVIKNDLVDLLSDYVEFVTVCPEMGIGLPAPREAIRVVTQKQERKLLGSYSGVDYTKDMETFVQTFMDGLDVDQIDGIILKGKSPTCGFKDVKQYPSHGKVQSLLTKTSGFFGGALKSAYSSLVIEDDGRLLNWEIRDHFLTMVFVHNQFRKVKVSNQKAKALVDFHSTNKYLFMAYNQSALQRLGRIIANHEKKPIDEVIEKYEKGLEDIYHASLKPGKNVNTLLHLFGYFKTLLSAEEKSFFLEQVEHYKRELVSLPALLLVLKGWVIRFDEPYLKNQTIFEHYPLSLNQEKSKGS